MLGFVLVLAVAGCGGSSTSSTTSTALTKSEFLAQGNAICAKGNKTISQATKKFGHKKPSQAQLNKFATQTLIPTIQQEINGVKALAPPTGDEAKVSAIVTSAQAALNRAKANPTILTGNGPSPFAATNKLAKSYGLTKCGGGG
jgi:hypothetical protein